VTTTEPRATLAAPEVGQLVRVRDRHWVVSDVAASALDDGGAQHLLELTSVEDDGLGDELSVIWEIEPGTAVLETATLPQPQADRFDDPERLDAFLDAVRWGAITSADSRALQAPFRSGITIEDYQLDPVVRALQMPRVNLLIADDVGLGKTIEAGLVVQELLLRHRARTVLVVCPASLSLKWQSEMADRFGGEEQVSVVWTGPASYEVPVRATSAVLAEVIEEARKSLIVVSFAAYKVVTIVEALKAAADRGVDVRLILESVVESKGNLTHDAKEAFDALGDTVSFYVWPAELRASASGGHAAMHAKCAVADGRVAFVTSANLTGAAMTDNMELGLVVRGGDVPRRIANHFNALMKNELLKVLD
jgi:phosphatidylserine/phosphatidylglycerophosphate/cardiolipin synthase-like enzyme